MPWLTHTLIFIFLCELKSCHWMVRSAVEKSPPKKVGLMMMLIIWKNSLEMLNWQEFFVCTKLLLTLLALLLLMSCFFLCCWILFAGRHAGRSSVNGSDQFQLCIFFKEREILSVLLGLVSAHQASGRAHYAKEERTPTEAGRCVLPCLQERETQKRAGMASGTATVVASTSRGRPDAFPAHALLHGDLRNRVSDERRQRFANNWRIRFPDFGLGRPRSCVVAFARVFFSLSHCPHGT